MLAIKDYKKNFRDMYVEAGKCSWHLVKQNINVCKHLEGLAPQPAMNHD